jgi:exodeoxyribonuclease VII small subunit
MDETVPVEKLTYEQALEELEQVVSALENEALTLEQAISLYERGRVLTEHCTGLLESAELRVKKLGEAEGK